MRIPFENADVEVLDLSEYYDSVKTKIETDTEEIPPEIGNKHFVILYLELIGHELGIIRIGDRIFVLDRHGVGEEALDDEKIEIAFRICIRVPEEEKFPIDKGMAICGRIYPVQIPKSFLLKLKKKRTAHLEDFIIKFGEGLDNVYEDWRQIFMGIIN